MSVPVVVVAVVVAFASAVPFTAIVVVAVPFTLVLATSVALLLAAVVLLPSTTVVVSCASLDSNKSSTQTETKMKLIVHGFLRSRSANREQWVIREQYLTLQLHININQSQQQCQSINQQHFR
jgi:uncharacterized protein YhhL (DUF1145 family)